jgi:hypothetical protein
MHAPYNSIATSFTIAEFRKCKTWIWSTDGASSPTIFDGISAYNAFVLDIGNRRKSESAKSSILCPSCEIRHDEERGEGGRRKPSSSRRAGIPPCRHLDLNVRLCFRCTAAIWHTAVQDRFEAPHTSRMADDPPPTWGPPLPSLLNSRQRTRHRITDLQMGPALGRAH